ncbi:hypothetical protein E1B28_008080 [Marasmius oreades]|uniref:DUF6534 domain-containing protein n=1 Tax=Marasmius oreades TaxID=181124 RepID=A0A9P7S372_9AGAR|nr:uncharacterized protein E1B28_008080 [Marasmius oreades]KAG7094482.1 hypothetical protein E1B28_008080 [Marasmius oreades]
MSATSPLPVGQAIAAYIDPQYYGGVIAICMFGICISQTWTYIHTNDDRWPLQVTVAFIFLFVFGCTLLDALALNHYLVLEYGNIVELTRITPELSLFTLFTVVVIVTSDLCFATRVWRLRRVHWMVTASIALTAVGALIPGITLVNALFKFPTIGSLNNFHRKIEVGFINILAAVSQCMSTFALWYSFQAHINEIGPSTPQSVLLRLSSVVVNRGVLLTVCELLVAFLFFYHPERLYWSPFHQFLAPLYYITILATLNARRPEPTQPWELPPESPTTPSVTPSALEHGHSFLRAGLGNEMRMRMGWGITPFSLDAPGASARGNPSLRTRTRTSTQDRKPLPQQAFAALTPDFYKQSPNLAPQEKKKGWGGTNENRNGSDISLVDLATPELLVDQKSEVLETPRRQLPPIPPPALLPRRTV